MMPTWKPRLLVVGRRVLERIEVGEEIHGYGDTGIPSERCIRIIGGN